jgi:hypothetical protein
MDHEQKSGAEAGTEREGADQPGAVDIVKLADKVQRLLIDELRLERARGAQLGRGRG